VRVDICLGIKEKRKRKPPAGQGGSPNKKSRGGEPPETLTHGVNTWALLGGKEASEYATCDFSQPLKTEGPPGARVQDRWRKTIRRGHVGGDPQGLTGARVEPSRDSGSPTRKSRNISSHVRTRRHDKVGEPAKIIEGTPKGAILLLHKGEKSKAHAPPDTPASREAKSSI